MRVLITGGAGFIGSHLAKFHLANNDEVLAIDDLSTGTIKNIAPLLDNPLFQFSDTDILTSLELGKYVAWVDRIYHLASVVGVFEVLAKPTKVLATNIMGTERLLEVVSAKKNAQPLVVIASSSCVYGHTKKKILNESDDLIIKNSTEMISTYTISKLAAEEIGLAYHHSKNLKIVIARLFNVIGPNQQGRYGSVVPRFIKQACNDEPITVYGDGTQTRSFCDVRDTVFALNLLANASNAIGEIVNVGNNREITINYLAELIKKRANSHSKIIKSPYQKAYGDAFTDISHRCPDINKLLKLTNMKFAWTLDQTIDLLISLQKEKIYSSQ